MSTPIGEFDQAPEDINQAVDDKIANIPPISVTVSDPARVIEMPARNGGMRTYDLSTTVPTKVLDFDSRRKRAVVSIFDTAGASGGARLGPTQASVSAPSGSFLYGLAGPGIAAGNVANAPLELRNMEELWALAIDAACTCSVLNEQWAD
jgi:hypothetical protein